MDPSSLNSVIATILQTKPEYILMALTIVMMPVLAMATIVLKRQPYDEEDRHKLISELLNNPAVQDRMRDPNTNLTELVEQMVRLGAPSPTPSPVGRPSGVGFWTKVSHDITWDVSGIIGLIVTVVLMFMVVSRSFGDMPREL
ncbi:hypothetical protein JJE66_33820 [Bradyrhizobium diazoefficiens]|uniref:hypothetical protein n=1 Tax=Bradyrhizobium diazoefficiens TaxID=1355477 RepID=UPI00190DB956|nr:hypothetical protein [Bradyrhizobium diazoefficiens]MBK3666187.1 hypothetical protein [Bradyrhizobium diazoefficiens]